MDNGQNNQGNIEALGITSPPPFWVEDTGWLKASLLEQGMTLLDKHGLPNVTILSQTKLDHTETVYNFEVQDFHTYHIGRIYARKTANGWEVLGYSGKGNQAKVWTRLKELYGRQYGNSL